MSKRSNFAFSKSNRELTDNDKNNLTKWYNNLLKEYRNKLVQLLDNPVEVVLAFSSQKIIEDVASQRIFVTYVRTFPLRKQQNEALFHIIDKTTYDELLRIEAAFVCTGNRRLSTVFRIIRARLTASVNKNIPFLEAITCTSTTFIPQAGDSIATKDFISIDDGAEEMMLLEAYHLMESKNASSLHLAALEGDYRAVKDLLKDEAYKKREIWFTSDDKTPLHYAALGENSKLSLEFTKALIKEAALKGIIVQSADAETDVIDTVDGPTSPSTPPPIPLFTMTLEKLLNFQDATGDTALHLAAEKESVQFVQFLCEKGADIVKKRKYPPYTSLDIMYDKAPEAVVKVLNGALTAESLSQDGNLRVLLDFRSIIGSSSSAENECPYGEMELLANMVFKNWRESMKIILPHVVVKTFLDLKWQKFRAPMFFFTALNVILHLWFTCFVIQVFIVSYPFTRANGTGETNAEPALEMRNNLTFFGYLRGNWESPLAQVPINGANNPFPIALYAQGIGLMVAALVLLGIEFIELYLILQIATVNSARKVHMKYRHVVLSFIITAVAVYDENMEAAICGILLLLLHVYDEISDRKGEMRFQTVRRRSTYFPLLGFFLIVSLYILASAVPMAYYNKYTTGVVSIISLFLFLLTFFGGGDYDLGDEVDGQRETANGKLPTFGARTLLSTFVNILHSLRSFLIRLSAYSSSVENILQLIYVVLKFCVSSVVFQTQICSAYYVSAAMSVVLSWTLILMQIGNIYGLGIYVQIFQTVLKRFLGVMSMYSVLLVAFSIAFTIIFPEENLFTTLPASFFRVVSMMVGELNFDDLFHKEGNEALNRAFPYTSNWIHIGFVVTVTIVLINLLIGLTVSDIERIFAVSDVIHRSIQVERLYLMERLYLDVPLFRCFNRGNIHVIPAQCESQGYNRLEIRMGIKHLPKALHAEIRVLAEDPKKYEELYLKKS